MGLNVTTRREFTENILSKDIPDDAAAPYKKLANSLKDLLRALAYHEAMTPNIDQAFMTPAAYKNKIYFMWDFVGRTLGMLLQVDPKNPSGEAWEDVKGRSTMGQMLLTGGMSNQLKMMCQDDRGQDPALGDEVTNASHNVTWE